jgi:hypothetical protein
MQNKSHNRVAATPLQHGLETLAPAAGAVVMRSTSVSDWRLSSTAPMLRIKVFWSPAIVIQNRVEHLQAAARDVAMLRELHNDFFCKQVVIEFADTRFSDARRLVMMEIWHDTLYEVLKTDSLRNKTKVASKLAWALVTLHQRSVLHGNLTPHAVRITKDEAVFLADFGWSRAFNSKGHVGQPLNCYMDPAVLREGRSIGLKSDWWALLGCLIAIDWGVEALAAESWDPSKPISGHHILMSMMDHAATSIQPRLRALLEQSSSTFDDIVELVKEFYPMATLSSFNSYSM